MKPIVLAILDGWGISPVWGGNAIEMNSPKHFNQLWRSYPHLILKSMFGRSDKKLLANSEIGHMMIGSGQDVMSDCEFIDNQIAQPEFISNPNLSDALNYAAKYNSSIHLIGMVSEGCIHSSLRHLISILEFCKRNQYERIFIHAITDGRDVPEASAGIYLAELTKEIKRLNIGKIASICGRYYAMDRDNHYDRTELFYKTITGSKYYNKALDPSQAIEQAYKKNISDEFIPATAIFENGFPVAKIQDNDSVILFNFRSDRMRQLVSALEGNKRFGLFSRAPRNLKITSILKYHFDDYLTKNIQTIFPEKQIESTLSQIIAENKLRQLKVAESEKLAHVTYFLNGGIDKPYPNEDRIIIKSSDVSNFALEPMMKSKEITEAILEAASSGKYSLIVANYANVDEVAHTGDILATSKAVDAVDESLEKLSRLVEKNAITLIVTADHGNAEAMIGEAKNYNPETFHTINPVPLIIADVNHKLLAGVIGSSRADLLAQIAQSHYSLKDIAPTILNMLNIGKPAVMTGRSLLPALRINWKSNESSS